MALLVATFLAAACGGSDKATAAATAVAGLPADLIGTWTSTVTKADLQAKGLTDEHALNENSGVFTLTLGADGTWSEAQTSLDGSPVMNPVFRGTWTGGSGTFVETTTFPTPFADHGVTLTWRIEDGKLVLTVPDPPDELYALGAEMHPWTRVNR
jgi:hypothetical protein